MTSSRTLTSGVRAGSRSAQVAAELGRRIVGRTYAAGTTLPMEASLLEEFGVSRTVLRDAIKSLESKGLLEARQRRGTCVMPRNGWNMLDAEVLGWVAQSGADPQLLIRLTELRQIVEPGACALAAQSMTDAGMQRIEAAWSRMVVCVDDPVDWVEADRDFHVALLTASGNEYLAAICTAISTALTASLRRTNPTARSNRESLPAHERIIVALRKRDGVAAALESRRQLDEAMLRLRAGVRKR
jgi:GntR family transcriptional regulator, galactonate operon transcriptional repressor